MIVSWRPDPGATYVDVFSITWETKKKLLCFPLIYFDFSWPVRESEGGSRGHK